MIAIYYTISMYLITAVYGISWRRYIENCHNEYQSCVSEKKTFFCLCDALCVNYDDCCFDAWNVTRDSLVHDDVELKYLNKMSCESVGKDTMVNINRNKGVFLVSSCPEHLGDQVDEKQKCENNSSKNDVNDVIPVTDARSNISFKNRHCAKCNHVEDWIPWMLEIHCGPKSFLYNGYRKSFSLIESLKQGIQDKDCGHRFLSPKFKTIRQCFQMFKYNILNTLSEYNKTTCGNRVVQPVQYAGEVYRHLDCFLDAMRLNYPNLTLNLPAMCFLGWSFGYIAGRDKTTTLMSVFNTSTLFQGDLNSSRCGETEIELSEKVYCRRLYCPINTEANSGICQSALTSADGKILDLLVEVNDDVNGKYASWRHVLFRPVFKTILPLLVLHKCIKDIGDVFARHTKPKVIPGKDKLSDNPCFVAILRYPLKREAEHVCSTEYERLLVMNKAMAYDKIILNGITLQHVHDVTNTSCITNISLENPRYIMDQHWSGTHLPCPAVQVDILWNISDPHITHNGREVVDTTSNDFYFDLNGTTIDISDIVYYNDEYYLCVQSYLSKYRNGYRSSTFRYLVSPLFMAFFTVWCNIVSFRF